MWTELVNMSILWRNRLQGPAVYNNTSSSQGWNSLDHSQQFLFSASPSPNCYPIYLPLHVFPITKLMKLDLKLHMYICSKIQSSYVDFFFFLIYLQQNLKNLNLRWTYNGSRTDTDTRDPSVYFSDHCLRFCSCTLFNTTLIVSIEWV